MLKRLATVAACAVLVGAPLPALADGGNGGPVQVGGDYHNGVVTTTVNSSGNQPTQSTSSTSGGVTCTWTLDDVDNAALLEGAEPGSAAAAAASAGGLYYNIHCSDGSYYQGVFVPGATAGGPIPTPGSLAQQAVNRLPLPSPAAQHNPSGDAVVNLPTWWWVAPQQWRALQQRTSIGPIWAQVTATPVRSVWNAGDGTLPLSCAGGGTPYDTQKPASQQTTRCSHTYTFSSANQPQVGANANDRFFTVTVTVLWRIRWVGAGGAAGSLPAMSRTTAFPLRVVERQTVVTGGSG